MIRLKLDEMGDAFIEIEPNAIKTLSFPNESAVGGIDRRIVVSTANHVFRIDHTDASTVNILKIFAMGALGKRTV